MEQGTALPKNISLLADWRPVRFAEAVQICSMRYRRYFSKIYWKERFQWNEL